MPESLKIESTTIKLLTSIWWEILVLTNYAQLLQCILKDYANTLKIKKAWKQVENGMELNGCYRMKVSPKAIAIPILTAMVLNIIKEDAVRIVGLGDSTIVIHLCDSWSTIVMMIVLFYYHDSSRYDIWINCL